MRLEVVLSNGRFPGSRLGLDDLQNPGGEEEADIVLLPEHPEGHYQTFTIRSLQKPHLMHTYRIVSAAKASSLNRNSALSSVANDPPCSSAVKTKTLMSAHAAV